MKRFLFAHVLLICGLALTLSAELSAGRAAAATREARLAREAREAREAWETWEAVARAVRVQAEGGFPALDVAPRVNGTPVVPDGAEDCTFIDAGTPQPAPAPETPVYQPLMRGHSAPTARPSCVSTR